MPDFKHFWDAASLGRTEELQPLLARGANIEERGGMTQSSPLHAAARMGCSEAVKLLLDHGADVSSCDLTGRTPLQETAASGHVKVALLLLQNGAAVSAQSLHEGATAMHFAARYGDWSANLSVLRLLISKGADTSAKDNDGGTALFWAARDGKRAVVPFLLFHDKGADLQSMSNGRTPEDVAFSRSHLEVAAMLKAEALRRATCEAFAMGQHERLGEGSRVRGLEPEVVRMLLQAGGLLPQRNVRGWEAGDEEEEVEEEEEGEDFISSDPDSYSNSDEDEQW